MSTEQRSAFPKLVALTVLGIGLLLFALSAQRLRAHYQIAFVPSAVGRALASGRSLPEPMLANALQRYSAALEILPENAELQRDYGRLWLRRAILVADDRETYREAMSSAAAHFKAAIVAAPAQAFSWSLASASLLEASAPVGEIDEFLRMSYFLGPHEGSSILLRAQVASRSWGGLDSDVQQFIRKDFKAIWQSGSLRPTIIGIYLDAPLNVRVVIRDSIIHSEADGQGFDRMLFKAL